VVGRVAPTEVLRRDQAQAGDLVYVTGPLGQAAAGLEVLRRGLDLPEAARVSLLQAFLDPRPQVPAGRVLARQHLATAAIDLSDGLASDLHQICLLSGVGAVVEADQVPIPEEVAVVADLTGRDALDLALKGGEDYQLLFTARPEKNREIASCFRQAGLAVPRCIGALVSGTGVRLRRQSGEVDISGSGYDHFRAGSDEP
jgi:thiamine-monophosphate kinase